MPLRTVGVKLTANAAGYLATIGKATAATQAFASKGSAALTKHTQSFKTLTTGVGIFGAAVALGIGAAVKATADFDQAMSGVAATGQDAKNNLQALRDAAIQAGQATKFSATEAAGGIEALAKAGVS